NAGGVLAIGVHGDRHTVRQYSDSNGTPIPFNCGNSSQGFAQVYFYATRRLGLTSVAFGSDINGLAGLTAPRFGTSGPSSLNSGNMCGHAPGDHGTPYPGNDPRPILRYPFDDYEGHQVTQQTFGNRTFDFNTQGFSQVGQYPELMQD